MFPYEDPIYGWVQLPDEYKEVINTRVFQRLKDIRQFGCLYFVHESADLKRYEHGIGTCIAARKFLDALERNSNIIIDPLYRTAIEVAALLHDSGHGPFSISWKYLSIEVGFPFDNLEYAKVCVDDVFKEIPNDCLILLRNNDNYGIQLVKDLIVGNPSIPTEFQYIFQIVENKETKLSVCKWDYARRDYFYLGKCFGVTDKYMDFDDVFENARISKDNQHIEYRYEDLGKIFNIFATIRELAKKCYMNPRHLAFENILQDLMKPHFTETLKILAKKKFYNISRFLKLTDSRILNVIEGMENFRYFQGTGRDDVIIEFKGPFTERSKEFTAPRSAIELRLDLNKFHFYDKNDEYKNTFVDCTYTLRQRKRKLTLEPNTDDEN